jgi:hypothetical protein
MESGSVAWRCNLSPKGEKMEYLITIALVSMAALYALIIVGCFRQPEW